MTLDAKLCVTLSRVCRKTYDLRNVRFNRFKRVIMYDGYSTCLRQAARKVVLFQLCYHTCQVQRRVPSLCHCTVVALKMSTSSKKRKIADEKRLFGGRQM